MSTSRFPHVLTLLTGCILLAAALSYVLPAGRYDRQEDEATGREVVVAVLTMPVLVPLSDLLGMSRQVTVLAYQYGAGLCDLLTPTNGALMAILATAGVRYEQWVKFAVPLYLLVAVVGMVGIVVAVGIGLA